MTDEEVNCELIEEIKDLEHVEDVPSCNVIVVVPVVEEMVVSMYCWIGLKL